MNFFELIEQSRIGREQAQKLRENIFTNVHYEFIDRINEVLSALDENQQKIVKRKFNNFRNLSQLHDKLFEILVAYRFLDKKPIFGDDANSSPDLLLQKTEEYIEVKRLNNSDFQKNAVEFMQKSNQMFTSTSIIDSSSELRKENSVNKKAYELINKAVKQLGSKKGYIFLLYNLDLLNYLKDLNTREEEFKKIIQSYTESLSLKDISFEIIHENELFGKVKHYNSNDACK